MPKNNWILTRSNEKSDSQKTYEYLDDDGRRLTLHINSGGTNCSCFISGLNTNSDDTQFVTACSSYNYIVNEKQENYCCYVTYIPMRSINRPELKVFINLIDSHIGLGNIKNEVLARVNLSKSMDDYQSEIESVLGFSLNENTNTPNKISIAPSDLNKVIDLLLEAQKYGHDDLFMKITNYCADKIELENCYTTIAKAVPKECSYYQEVNYNLYNYFLNGSNKKSEISRHELVELFRYAHLSEDTRLINAAYGSLCGYPLGHTFKNDIKGEFETLVELADNIYELNKKIQSKPQPEKTNLKLF